MRNNGYMILKIQQQSFQKLKCSTEVIPSGGGLLPLLCVRTIPSLFVVGEEVEMVEKKRKTFINDFPPY